MDDHLLKNIIIFRTTIYVEHVLAWFDLKSQAEVLSHKVFTMILQAMGAPGLSGLDKMMAHFVAVEMQNVVKFIDKGIKNKTWATSLKELETFQNVDSFKSNESHD